MVNTLQRAYLLPLLYVGAMVAVWCAFVSPRLILALGLSAAYVALLVAVVCRFGVVVLSPWIHTLVVGLAGVLTPPNAHRLLALAVQAGVILAAALVLFVCLRILRSVRLRAITR